LLIRFISNLLAVFNTLFSKKVNHTLPTGGVALAFGTARGYTCAVEQTGQQDRTWEVLCHLSALSLVVVGIPLANVIGPLIIWFIRKEASRSVDRHGRAALNFQISMTVYFVALFILTQIPLGPVTTLGHIGLRAWTYLNLILILRATYQATKGELAVYPLSIRFLPQ
jgi:hypothetical protein